MHVSVTDVRDGRTGKVYVRHANCVFNNDSKSLIFFVEHMYRVLIDKINTFENNFKIYVNTLKNSYFCDGHTGHKCIKKAG